ncbi:hypothetical protein JW877_00690 [bacterium]|nr:hypothetical protein [bacterium]
MADDSAKVAKVKGKESHHKVHSVEELSDQHKEELEYEEANKRKIKGFRQDRLKNDSHLNKAKSLRSHRSIRGRRGT